MPVPQEIFNPEKADSARGIVHVSNEHTIDQIKFLLDHPVVYYRMSTAGQEFSRQYTTEKFEAAIKDLLHS